MKLFLFVLYFLPVICTTREVFEYILLGRKVTYSLRVHEFIVKYHSLHVSCPILKSELQFRYDVFQAHFKSFSQICLLKYESYDLESSKFIPTDFVQIMKLKLHKHIKLKEQLRHVPEKLRSNFELGIYEWNQVITSSIGVSFELLRALKELGHFINPADLEERVRAIENLFPYLMNKKDLEFYLHLCEYVRHLLTLKLEESISRGYWRRLEISWNMLVNIFKLISK